MENDLKRLFADILDIPESDVNDELLGDDVDTWDSMNHLRLITALEQEFSIQFSMDEIQSVTGYATLRDIVSAKLPGE